MSTRVKVLLGAALYAPVLGWTALALTFPTDRAPAGWHSDLLMWGSWVALFCILGGFGLLTIEGFRGALGKAEEVPRGTAALAVVLASYLLAVHFAPAILGVAVDVGVRRGHWPRLVAEVALWSGFVLGLSALMAGVALGVARLRTEPGRKDWVAGVAVLVGALGALPLIVLGWVAVTTLFIG